MNVEPREAMRIMPHSVELDRTISAGVGGPRFASSRFPPGSLYPPSEAAGHRRIVEHFFQPLLRQAQLFAALLRHSRLHALSPAIRSTRPAARLLCVIGPAAVGLAAAPAALGLDTLKAGK